MIYESPCHCAVLRQAARKVSQYYDSALSAADLNNGQLQILANVDRSDGTHIQKLADMVLLERTALSHNLRPLERDKLVEIRADSDDGRGRLVTLTSRGERKRAAGNELWLQVHSRFERLFGVDRTILMRSTLLELLDTTL